LYEEGHQNVLAVIDLVLTLPASSAVNECGFSQMKLTKTSVRSRMSNATLNHSMVIQMATTDVKQFDPDPAINKWFNGAKRPRRPAFKHGSSRKCARLENNPHPEVEVVEVAKGATAPAEPDQLTGCEAEEEDYEEDEVWFNDKGDNEAEDDEGVISDYESEPKMSEEFMLQFLENEL